MKHLLCVFALAVATLVVVAPAAQATHRPCVNRLEYILVHRGMPKHRVHRIFDTRGRRVAKHGNNEIRSYRACTRRSAVSVTYKQRRVRVKSAVWGSRRHRRH
jgi:hypothetical protein